MEVLENKLDISGRKNNTKIMKNNTGIVGFHTKLAQKHTELGKFGVFLDNLHTKIVEFHIKLGNLHTKLGGFFVKLDNLHTKPDDLHTIPDRKHTKLFEFHTMTTRNNTKLAALFAISAALLTVLAQNNAVAAPTDKVPVTVETAQTLSYTVTSYAVDAKGHDVPVYSNHVYVSRPDNTRVEFCDAAPALVNNKLIIVNGKDGTRYDALKNTYAKFTLKENNLVNIGLPPPPAKLEHVVFKAKPALMYSDTTQFGEKIHYTKQTFYDANTHETLNAFLHFGGSKVSDKPGLTIVFTDWKLNPKLDPALFVFTPPPGSKLIPDDNNTP